MKKPAAKCGGQKCARMFRLTRRLLRRNGFVRRPRRRFCAPFRADGGNFFLAFCAGGGKSVKTQSYTFCYVCGGCAPFFSAENARVSGKNSSETVTAAHTVCTAMTGSDA